MNSSSLTSRWTKPALMGAIMLVVAAAALAAFAAGDGQARNRHARHARAAMVPMLTAKAVAFHDAMRALWQTHGTYTERAIVDYVGGNPDATRVIARLQRNQVDIGNAVKPYYGAAGGTALTKLLHAHIADAVATVVAAKAGNAAATKKASAKFYANGRQIAVFLHKANPQHWSLKAMNTMMKIHLDQVVGLAVDQIKGQYGAAIALYDRYIHHILFGMADMLSSGIIEQFPSKFQ